MVFPGTWAAERPASLPPELRLRTWSFITFVGPFMVGMGCPRVDSFLEGQVVR